MLNVPTTTPQRAREADRGWAEKEVRAQGILQAGVLLVAWRHNACLPVIETGILQADIQHGLMSATECVRAVTQECGLRNPACQC